MIGSRCWLGLCQRVSAIILVLLLVVGSSPAAADSLVDPRTEYFRSANGQYRVVLDPYPEEAAVLGRRPTLAHDMGGNPSGDLVTLQRVGANGSWQTVWSRFAIGSDFGGHPERAIVRSDGQFVVTVGNYIATGSTGNEVVIYDQTGRVIRSFSLIDLTSQLYFEVAPRSISSIQWLAPQDASLDQRQNMLLLPIADPSPSRPPDERESDYFDTLYVQRVALADGRLVALSTDEQERVQATLCQADFRRFAHEMELVRAGYRNQRSYIPPIDATCVRAREHDRLVQKWQIAGAVAGFVVLIVAGFFWWRRRRITGAAQ
jgi:hypothetical protein